MQHSLLFASELEESTDALEALLGAVLSATLEAEGVRLPCELDILFTDERGIHEINLEQRGVDAPTDVLSFPMFPLTPGVPLHMQAVEADPATGLVPLGDMVLNLQRCRAQAAEFGHSEQRELSYLAVHSVLHLLGYDHLDEGAQKRQMRAREEAILASLKLSR